MEVFSESILSDLDLYYLEQADLYFHAGTFLIGILFGGLICLCFFKGFK